MDRKEVAELRQLAKYANVDTLFKMAEKAVRCWKDSTDPQEALIASLAEKALSLEKDSLYNFHRALQTVR